MKKRVFTLLIISMFVMFLTGCLATTLQASTNPTTLDPTTDATITTASTTSIPITTSTTLIPTTVATTVSTMPPVVDFDYLGETPPTNNDIRFDPSGFIATSTWFWHSSPVFSPDGNEMYWSKYLVETNHIQIWYTRKVDGQWTTAIKLEIPGINGDTNCPVFVPGDEGLYFINYYNGSFVLYRATRTVSGWGNPVIVNVPIPQGLSLDWSFSISDNKNLYLSLSSTDGSGVSQIYLSIYNDGVYEVPILIENLGTGLYGNFDPAIAPDESFLIFVSRRNNGFGYHDLYICFRMGVGVFTEPISMGTQINTTSEDGRPHISPDGLYLFFTTEKAGDKGYNSYWIKLDQLDVLTEQ